MTARKNLKRPIRVVFLLLYFEAWDSLSLVYQSMLEDPSFDPIVVSIPRKLTGDDGYGGEKKVHKFLKRQGIDHLRLNDDDSWKGLESLKELEPDYVFLNYPWQRNYQPAFRPDSLVKFTRILYTPYFLAPLVNEGEAPDTQAQLTSGVLEQAAAHLYTQRTHQLASLVFVQDQATKDAFATTERSADSVIFTGSPKLDSLRENYNEACEALAVKAEQRHITAKAAAPKHLLTVLWAPHHSYSPAWLNFGMFSRSYLGMLDLARRYPTVRFVLRPHPFLFGTLEDRGVISSENLGAWKAEWKSLPNTKLNSKAKFVKQFASADILLTDGISFLAEYPLLTGKPGVFLENPAHWPFNVLGSLAAGANHRISEVSQFEPFITSMLETSATGTGPHELNPPKPAKAQLGLQANLDALRAAIDPHPGASAAKIVTAVLQDFASGSRLVDASKIVAVAWEDQPGREPRTD